MSSMCINTYIFSLADADDEARADDGGRPRLGLLTVVAVTIASGCDAELRRLIPTTSNGGGGGWERLTCQCASSISV